MDVLHVSSMHGDSIIHKIYQPILPARIPPRTLLQRIMNDSRMLFSDKYVLTIVLSLATTQTAIYYNIEPLKTMLSTYRPIGSMLVYYSYLKGLGFIWRNLPNKIKSYFS